MPANTQIIELVYFTFGGFLRGTLLLKPTFTYVEKWSRDYCSVWMAGLMIKLSVTTLLTALWKYWSDCPAHYHGFRKIWHFFPVDHSLIYKSILIIILSTCFNSFFRSKIIIQTIGGVKKRDKYSFITFPSRNLLTSILIYSLHLFW